MKSIAGLIVCGALVSVLGIPLRDCWASEGEKVGTLATLSKVPAGGGGALEPSPKVVTLPLATKQPSGAEDAGNPSPADQTPARGVTLEAGRGWIPLTATPEILPGSALDFSAMRPTEAPAGKHGRVVCRGAHFEFEHRRGEPVRFYGVNLCFGANYPELDEARRLAANLARIGYNAVRIHHHDGGLVQASGDSTKPNPEMLRKLDGLVASCIEQGLYVTTDLFVSRRVPWNEVGIARPGNLSQDEYKLAAVFLPKARANLKAFSKALLCHVNPFTGRRWADEPGLACLALINEGNLMNRGGKPLAKMPGCETAWKAWLAEKKRTQPKHYSQVPDSIPENAWAPGVHTPAFTQFLREREVEFAKDMKRFLREEVKTPIPITNLSSWWNPVVYQQVRSEVLDYVDDHFYVDHPRFLGKPWRLPSECSNSNPLLGEACGFPDVVLKRLLDRPFTITEYNYSGPGRFRGVGGIVTGAAAALQGWDGLWRFAWAHGIESIRCPGSRPMGYFNMADDPLSLAAERASICLYLRGDLPVLGRRCVVVLEEACLRVPDGKQRMSSAPWRWLGWYAQLGTVVGGKAPEGAAWSIGFPEAYEVKSEAICRRWLGGDRRPEVAGDGHIWLDNVGGSFTIATPRTCGGFAERGTIRAEGLVAELDSPGTVWVSSLDGLPIARSRRLLVTHLTDLQNSRMRYRTADLKVLEDWGGLPYLVRKGRAEVSLGVAPGGWTVYRLDTAGRRLSEVPAAWRGGRLCLTLGTDLNPSCATMLYEVVAQ
ncbi:MAG: hypothetical protein ACI4QD_06520 [Kiritimatiellia bacterium]